MWGKSILAKMALSGSLAPLFVNDCVTAEITYSTVHAHQAVLAWSQATLCYREIKAPPKKWQHYCFINQERILLWLLCQLGERLCCVRLCYGCCYSCCISQEKINMSAVTMAPRVSLQSLSLHLACPGLSEQCGQGEQQDNWRCEQDLRDNM